jgi:ABC transporter with metal-binding/Fe-S-binding domain ATP-binding protein
MKIAALYSGAKDSTLAIHKAIESGHEVKYLVSIVSENPESYMYHTPNIWITVLQSKALGIPIVIKKTKGEKEMELDALEDALLVIKDDIDAVSVGAIDSEYQYSRVKRICDNLGLKIFAPLWHKDPKFLWSEILRRDFKVIIISVSCEGIDQSWLGKVIDEDSLKQLIELSEKFQFHLSGEGGEFESLVLDCPLFKKRLKIEKTEKVWDKKTNSGWLKIEELRLVNK